MGYFEGFGVTFKLRQMGKRQRVTTEYPQEKRAKPERLHGRHVLNRYEDGMEKCIGCELCAGVCPARCIYVRGADNAPDEPVSPGERYGFVYEINYLRCIHCDLCVEACPTEAITETKLFEFSLHQPQDAIYTKAELLVGDDGRPQQLPWEDWSDGDDVDPDTSAWVRATAPRARAAYEGRVGVVGRARLRRASPPSSARPPRLDADRRAPTRSTQSDEDDVADHARRRWRTDGLDVVVFAHRRGDRARRRPRRDRLQQPGALRPHAGRQLVRHRRAVRRPGRPLPGRRAGHRLRRRHRRAVPVRDHAARRRPGRGPVHRAVGGQRPAAAAAGVGLLGVVIATVSSRGRRRQRRHRREAASLGASAMPGADIRNARPSRCSPTTSSPSRSRRCCS